MSVTKVPISNYINQSVIGTLFLKHLWHRASQKLPISLCIFGKTLELSHAYQSNIICLIVKHLIGWKNSNLQV